MQFTEEHLAFRETCAAFARAEILPRVDEAESTGRYPKELLGRAAELGLIGLSIPEALGGSGAGMSYICIATEELSKVCAGLAGGLTGGLGMSLLADHGTAAQQQRYLAPTIAGEKFGSFALTEPDAGSDVLNMKGRAVRTADGWHITANKSYITGSPFCDYMLLVAYTDPERRARGLSVFIVDADLPGIEIRPMDKLGHRSMETGLVFVDTVVPEDALLGEQGSGMTYVGATLEAGRISHAARSLGVARAAYEVARDHARERVTFGHTINTYQAIQFKLARMATAIRTTQLHVYDTAFRYESGASVMQEACMAKLVASETAVSVCSDALQILGGLGYMTESPVQRYLRDSYLYPISEGTTEIQLRTIARLAGISGERN